MNPGFIYANGRISAEETRLLDDRMWQMLMSASDEDEALRLLGDTWYGTFMQYHSMEECFLKAMEATEEELTELSEDPRLVRGILHRRDVRNARYLWKRALFRENSLEKIEVERPGLIEIDVLKNSVASEEAKDELPELFKRALEDILDSAEMDTGPFDRRMDKLAAAVELEELTDVNPGFRNFVKTHLEQKNFLTAGRCYVDSVSRQEMADMLIPGGFHSREEIATAYQRGNLTELLGETPGLEDMAGEYEKALEEESFLGFERECDRRLLELLQKGAFPVFGPSPLASFVIRRELEISHLRLLLAAKSAGVGQERLRKRLPRG
jgi:V/A-type H+/Na+-transporting ATPase subunit C